MRGTQFAQLTAFAAVAEKRSFTKAAAHLGLSAPSVSEAVRSLQEDFGVRLLNRTTRHVALTEAGEQLLDHLTPAFANIDKAIDSVNSFRDKPAGVVRLSVHLMAAATIIGPLISKFSAAYPAIRLEISAGIADQSKLCDEFDAGIHQGACIPQDMVAIQIGEKYSLSTVASPDYLARSSPLSDPHGLLRHNCISCRLAGEERSEAWIFEKGGERLELAVKGSLSISDTGLAMRVALEGVGIVQLPEVYTIPLIAEGRLKRLFREWSTHADGFYLCYTSRRFVPAKLRAVIDFLRKEAKALKDRPQPSLDRPFPRPLHYLSDAWVSSLLPVPLSSSRPSSARQLRS